MIYADTSLIFSLYVADTGSRQATELLAGAKEALIWTAWHELEFTSALEARVSRGQNSRREADAVFAELVAHRERDGLFVRRKAEWDRVLERATKLAAQSGGELLCRSLDVLHVSLCLELGLSKFRTLDERQRKLAQRQGLEVSP
jgi:predicted nucleic acid-binding protein